MTDLLETRIAGTNAGFFLREFSYSKTLFRPAGASEIEIADHVVAIGDMLFLFQLKRREQPTGDPDAEATWFAKKVIKKGSKQIRDTLSYLSSGSVTLSNDRGHATTFPARVEGMRVVKAILYDAAPALPFELRMKKVHVSQSGGGTVHLLCIDDYEGILHTLVTMPEVVEYFEWREQMARAFAKEIETISEPALVGQFLQDPAVRTPISDADGLRLLACFQNDVSQFEIFGILHKFKEKTELGEIKGGSSSGREYYCLLSELVRLTRSDLVAFKERFLRAWDVCGGELVLPYRFTGSTDCAFVFIPMSAEDEEHSLAALTNLTYANRYELRLNRGIGVAFRRDGDHRLIDWMYEDAPWEPDPEVDELLREHYPFRPVQARKTQRYTFSR